MAFINTDAFNALRNIIEGDIIIPSDPTYDESLKRWSRLAERDAGAVIFVKTNKDVSEVIKYAVSNKIDLAIKGGGHNPSGASSSDGGIVIDLSRYMTSVNMDVEAKSVRVGGGALWGDVDAVTSPAGYGTVGGTVSHTGVAGLTLGGGIGNLSGKYGLSIDNIVDVTVVLADGRIVPASKEVNEDLFFGIRGGGCSFGVVTDFNFRMHALPPLCWGGLLTFSMDQMEQIYGAMRVWQDTVQTEDEGAWIMATTKPLGGGQHEKELILVCWHIGPEDVAKERYKLFLDLGADEQAPIANDTKEMPYAEINKQLDDRNPHGLCYYMTVASLKECNAQVGRNFLQAQEILLAAHPMVCSSLEMETFHLGKVSSVPVTDMAYAGRSTSKFGIVKINWDDDSIVMEEVQKTAREMVKIIESEGSEGEMTYPNLGQQTKVTGPDRAEDVFGVNYRKLQRIKAKYDPGRVFDKWLPIQPLA